jgi:hypothetical protein
VNAQPLAKAEIVIAGDTVAVQFNPSTLQVEISNSVQQQGESGATNQVSTQSSAKMGLDLVFDTTGSGEDVRNRTRALRVAVRPPQDQVQDRATEAGAAYSPPLVTFQWGTFIFAGIAESYRETLDFFSADGVPLRAQVALSLKEQAGEFTPLERPNPRGAASPSAFEVPGMLGGGGAAGVAARGGDLRAARAIATANGESSLRFASGNSLALGGGAMLREAVAFAPATPSLTSPGLSAGLPPALSGGSTAGRSAGLAASAPALRFDPARLQARAAPRQLATDAGASFAVDGRALPCDGAGLRSDVGHGRGLSARLRFDN